MTKDKYVVVSAILGALLIGGGLIYLNLGSIKGESVKKESSLDKINTDTVPTVTLAPMPTIPPITKLQVIDLKLGDGPEVKKGDLVLMHYVGAFQDGRVFDSSVARGQPFQVQIGVGKVIKGWDEGVPGMKKGGKRRLLVPADMAYGEKGAADVIPPNTPLVFELELLDMKSTEQPKIEDPESETSPSQTPTPTPGS